MNARTKRALRWIVQGLILAALLFFIFYVFFGPTGRETEDGGLAVQKHERRFSYYERSVNNESQSFILSPHITDSSGFQWEPDFLMVTFPYSDWWTLGTLFIYNK